MPNQYKALWQIPGAGPSVSTFHGGDAATTVSGAQAMADSVRAFFAAIAGWLPNEVVVTFESEVTRLQTETGQLVASTAVTPPASVQGTGTGVWAAGSGARVVWQTDAIRNGRRVVGSTFIVPVVGNVFSLSGTVTQTVATALDTAAENLITALDAQPTVSLCVYSRPRPGVPGAVSPVISATVPALAATLRGRKY